ncbi:MAG: transporter substrate-binding domain-containing protein [Candidatus Sedimenticola sp. 20ELBAFRAG]
MTLLRILTLCIVLIPTANASGIFMVTEEARPMHYMVDGKPSGPVIDLISHVMEQAGLDYTIKVLPWARAYQIAQNKRDTLIFSISRTEAREPMFKWVDTVISLDYHLYKLKTRTDINIKTLQDADEYRIGVLTNDVRHEYLKEQGLSRLAPVPSNSQNLGMLIRGRIDLLPMSNIGLQALCQKEAVDCAQFERAYKLDAFSSGLYFAYSKFTEDEIVVKTRSALELAKTDGTYQKIMGRFLATE